jgi:thioredoxin reductase (NADPH)
VTGRAVIIATGANYRKLPLSRLSDLEGMGVHYAATAVEANMCVATPIALVGGGNSAGQAALFLAATCVRVFMVVRRPELNDTMSRYLIDEIASRDNIEVITESEVRRLVGEQQLAGVEIVHRSGAQRRLDVSALFVFIGADPQTAWLPDQLARDEHGFILTGHDVPMDGNGSHVRAALETSIPGIFAAGDVRSGSIKRVASAVGEGAMAVHLVHSYLRARHA